MMTRWLFYACVTSTHHQAVDGAFLQYALGVLRREGASVHILFSFEYVILASSVLSISVKYLLFIADNLTEGRWEGKVQPCECAATHLDCE